VSIGYADGYPRHAKSGTPTLLNDKECPLIGRVSMDLIAIDVRNAPWANLNDEVILWGQGLPIEVIAKAADTIPYQLLCHVGNRVNHTVMA
jgi:alanine racemase